MRTVPTASLRLGNIHYKTLGGTTKTVTPTGVAAIDPKHVGESSTWLAKVDGRIPVSGTGAGQCAVTAAVGDGLNSTGCIFNSPNNDNHSDYVARGDYNINDKMKLFARFNIAREDVPWAANAWPGDPVTNPEEDRSYAFVVGHNWVIGNTMTNRVFLGETGRKADLR